jgi:recombination protein U
MIRYPGGIGKKPTLKKNKPLKNLSQNSFKNRGMTFEHDINVSNQYYLDKDKAVITKRPTPINVVKVDYQSGAKITHAYFEKQSTTDYNGIYRGKYLDFEAKSTLSMSSLPIANITIHQRKHLEKIVNHGGIAFLLISFNKRDEIFVLKAEDFLIFTSKENRKSLPYAWIQAKGALVSVQYQPRLDYLSAVDRLFF